MEQINIIKKILRALNLNLSEISSIKNISKLNNKMLIIKYPKYEI